MLTIVEPVGVERSGRLPRVNTDGQPAGDLTGLLQAWNRGEAGAVEQLAPLLQGELRVLARQILSRERRENGWQPTELVHESYLRLLDWQAVKWRNRAHFFATTATMMRRVLVDAARARRAVKRVAGREQVPLDAVDVPTPEPVVDVVAIGDALHALAAIAPRASQVVELRFFGGWSVEETAETLGVSVRTGNSDWNTARAWLSRELTKGGRHGQ